MFRIPAENYPKYILWKVAPSYVERRHFFEALCDFEKSGVALVHIPKTAGFSLSQAIYGRQIGHLTWNRIYWSSPNSFHELRKIAVWRHPVDRFVSAFCFLKFGGISEADKHYSVNALQDIDTINDFVETLKHEKHLMNAMRQVHFRPQHEFVCNKKGEIMVDYLLHFKSFRTDIGEILGRNVQERIENLNKAKVSKREPWAVLTKESIKAIEEIYKSDLALGDCLGGTTCVYRKKAPLEK